MFFLDLRELILINFDKCSAAYTHTQKMSHANLFIKHKPIVNFSTDIVENKTLVSDVLFSYGFGN